MNNNHRLPIAMQLIACLYLLLSSSAMASNLLGFPESGSWFNLAVNDRTGFNMEVQNGVLSGAYYGFDGDGNQVWLLFSGVLDIDSENDLYSFSGDLSRSSGGGCIIDCPESNTGVAHSVEIVGTIDIEFLGRSQARFRINDNAFQMIAPLIYGSSARQIFPAFPDVVLPNYQGLWSFDFVFPRSCSVNFFASVLEIGQQVVEADPVQVVSGVRESISDNALFPGQTASANVVGSDMQNSLFSAGPLAEIASANATVTPRCTPAIQTFFERATLICSVSSSDGVEAPICEMRSNTPVESGTPELILSFSPTNSSDSRIDGVVLQTRTDGGEPFIVGTFNAGRMAYD